jgi:integrase
LAALPDAQEARNVVISDHKVRAFVATAYARDHQLGLLVDVLAITGTRPSQAIRLRVEDFHNDPVKPFLRMPKSGKGGGRNRSQRKVERYNVPITPALAGKLQQAAGGREGAAPLLVRSSGNPWSKDPNQDYRPDMAAIVVAIGLDPNLVSVYALRHSSIVRALLRNVPVRLTAATHDTSISQIERNYSRYITEHADDFARVALLQHDESTADNVVVLPGANHG